MGTVSGFLLHERILEFRNKYLCVLYRRMLNNVLICILRIAWFQVMIHVLNRRQDLRGSNKLLMNFELLGSKQGYPLPFIWWNMATPFLNWMNQVYPQVWLVVTCHMKGHFLGYGRQDKHMYLYVIGPGADPGFCHSGTPPFKADVAKQSCASEVSP